MALNPASPPVFKIPQSVLVLIHTPALEVLLIRRTEPDPQAPAFWQSVTGSKDAHGEPWADTAAREVYEETSIDCRQGSPLAAQLQDWHLENVYPIYPRWLHRYAPGVAFNTERLFGLQVPAGTPVRLDAREHTRYQWLPYQQAAAMCFSPSNAEACTLLPRFMSGEVGTWPTR